MALQSLVVKHRTVVGVGVGLAAVFLSAVVSGQPQSRPATLDDFLAEVRALRADLKTTAAASLRAQALVARGTLQEQRLRAVSEELNRARTQLQAATAARADLEERVNDLTTAPVVGNAKETESMLMEMKRRLTRLQADERELTSQVGHWSGVVAQEQGRWEDLNRRIDALER